MAGICFAGAAAAPLMSPPDPPAPYRGGGVANDEDSDEDETGGAGEGCVGGHAQDLGVLHVRRAAGVGLGERLPVGCADVYDRCTGRAFGWRCCCGRGVRLPVGCVHMLRV